MTAISSKTFPAFKTLHQKLVNELKVIEHKSSVIHFNKNYEKQLTLLNYKKITHIKEQKPVDEIVQQIKTLESTKINGIPEPTDLKDTKLLSTLTKHIEQDNQDIHHKYKLNNLGNVVTFLSSQREYTELLERYNPGLTMSQEDNVRKTAKRVGLEVPE
ncbi:uncharacterized protein RJT21DRAFT_117659 [Scheffersomyces amazonensis]|uniref:uncharacterized protein n=1 Tax=Scheffersomyces amazonensis TaxID=1078765 RepID=UPI00315DBF47